MTCLLCKYGVKATITRAKEQRRSAPLELGEQHGNEVDLLRAAVGAARIAGLSRTHPMPAPDAYSRYVLAVVGMHRPTFESTKAVFEALLRNTDCPNKSTQT